MLNNIYVTPEIVNNEPWCNYVMIVHISRPQPFSTYYGSVVQIILMFYWIIMSHNIVIYYCFSILSTIYWNDFFNCMDDTRFVNFIEKLKNKVNSVLISTIKRFINRALSLDLHWLSWPIYLLTLFAVQLKWR